MTAENFSAFNLAEEGIYIAFISCRYVISDAVNKFARERFAPKPQSPSTFHPPEAQAIIDQLERGLPGGIAITKILQ